jgi:hypothetical protein
LLNVIESLRECLTWPSSELSSNSLSPTNRRTPTPIHTSLSNNEQYLSINRLQTFLTSIYTNLNKRLPSSQQIIHIDNCVHSAIAWFLYVYNNNNESSNNFSIRFNSFRVVLVLLCTGKLVDKMRHLFTSYLSSSSSLNSLTYGQIDELLHEILALPYALQEISHSTYRTNNAQLIFSHLSTTSINLNDFLDILIYNDTTPNCLQWLIIFHRLISVENGKNNFCLLKKILFRFLKLFIVLNVPLVNERHFRGFVTNVNNVMIELINYVKIVFGVEEFLINIYQHMK